MALDMARRMAWVVALALVAAPALAAGVPAVLKHAGLDLMPWPAHIELAKGRLPLTRRFEIAVAGDPGRRVYGAATRLLQRLQRRTDIAFDQHAVSAAGDSRHATLVVRVGRPGVLKIGEDESYRLRIDAHRAVLTAADGIGALRGLQTVAQLLQTGADGYYLPAVRIRDAPRFQWRGLMIDVARHFEPVHVIERNLRGMAAVKMNVLHLHLSDNQGFRIESKVFPELAAQGSDGQYYTQGQIKRIIRYADDRGIIVVPEFDLPAHALAFLVSHPELASAPGPYRLMTRFGGRNPAFDPANPETYRFLGRFFKEMAGLFPGPYMHIGGDENSGRQWASNPSIQACLQTRVKAGTDLQTHFTRKLDGLIQADGKRVVGWDEILQPGLGKGAIIQSWRGKESLYEAAREGHQAILSNGYYLDLMDPASQYYLNDPVPPGTHLRRSVRDNILGGEAEMWGELVRPATIDSRIWPNAAAIAERLWSPRDVRDAAWMQRRLRAVDLQLESLGLTQLRNPPALMRQLAGGYDIQPLRVLVGVISPVRGYQRMASGDYTVYSPLASIADAATGNPWAAIRFERLVKRFVRHPDAATAQAIRTQLDMWRENAPALEALIARAPALHAVQPLAQSLATLSGIGLRALAAIERHQALPAGWAWQTTSAFLQAREPAAAAKLRVVDAVEQLVVAAVKSAASTGNTADDHAAGAASDKSATTH
jgi:hexosaminidase